MLKRLFSTSSALGMAFALTSAWVGQAQAFVYFDQVTYVKGTTGYNFDYTCNDLQTRLNTMSYGHAQAYEPWSGCGKHDTRYKPSSLTTSTAALRTATEQVTGLISGRMAAVKNPGTRGYVSADHIFGNGLSAGQPGNVGYWFNVAWADIEDDLSSTAFTGDVVTTMVGADVPFWFDGMRLGLGVGYERTDISTSANQGSLRGKGVTLASYLSYNLNDMFNFDAQLGYARMDYDQRRKDPGATSIVTTYIDDSDAQRAFAAINVNAHYDLGDWKFDSRFGGLYAYEHEEDIIDTDGIAFPAHSTQLGRVNLGLDMAYDFEYWIEPYFGFNMLYDFHQTDVKVASADGTSPTTLTVVQAGQAKPKNDKFGVVYTAGLRFDIDQNFDAVLSYGMEAHRSDFDKRTLMFSANAAF